LTDLTAAPRRGSNLLVSLAALIVFAILVALGLWQVERLHWKETLIATSRRASMGSPGLCQRPPPGRA
jgi:surfeit locus 1 family protein